MKKMAFYVISISVFIVIVVLSLTFYAFYLGINERVKGLERFNNQISVLMESDDKQVETN